MIQDPCRWPIRAMLESSSANTRSILTGFCTGKGDSLFRPPVIHFRRSEATMARFELSDIERQLTKPLLPNKLRGGVARVDDRQVLKDLLRAPDRFAVAGPARALWPLLDGLQLLQLIGPDRNVGSGVRDAVGQVAGLNGADRQFDHLRPPACHRREKGPGSRHRPFSWRSTKINAVVDENALPVRLMHPAGQAHDLNAAPELKCRHVVAARGYHANALLDLIRASTHIPSASRRLSHRFVNQPTHLPTAQSRRALLQAQALAAHRNPLRQART